MKILFLSAANSVHTVRWVNALIARNHIVYLVYLKDHKNTDHSLDDRVKMIELPIGGSKGYYLNAPYLHRIARKIRPEIVNGHYASGYGTLMRVARLKNTVLSVWGSDVYEFPYQNQLTMRIVKKNLLYAQKVASTSKCMAKQVRRLLNKNINITITPFGVDLLLFKGKEDRDNSEKIVIGCIKALEAKYGLQYLIMGIRLLIDSLNKDGYNILADKIQCLIYGEGKEKEKIEKIINEQGLENIVTLMGKIPHKNVPEVLEHIDIFCATSINDSESFGVAVVEAQSMSIPVVVSNTDGYCEVVEDHVTGLIVKKESSQEVADALKKMVLNKQLRETMGKAGRKRVEKFYDWNKNVTAMEICYESIIHEK